MLDSGLYFPRFRVLSSRFPVAGFRKSGTAAAGDRSKFLVRTGLGAPPGQRAGVVARDADQEMPRPLRMVCTSTVTDRIATATTLIVATILKARPLTASPRTLLRLARTRT